MISHSQDFLNGVCTNIIHMHKQKLVYYGVRPVNLTFHFKIYFLFKILYCIVDKLLKQMLTKVPVMKVGTTMAIGRHGGLMVNVSSTQDQVSCG